MTPTRHGSLRADRSDSGGFTLVEMLVVLVIVSVLLAVSFVTYGSYKRHKIASTTKSQVRYAADALESCAAGQALSSYENCATPALLAADRSLKNLIDESADSGGGITGENNPEGAQMCTPAAGKVCIVVSGSSYVVVGLTAGAEADATLFIVSRAASEPMTRRCSSAVAPSGVSIDIVGPGSGSPSASGSSSQGGTSGSSGTPGSGAVGGADGTADSNTRMCPTGRW